MSLLKDKKRILVTDDWEINIELIENTLQDTYNLSVALNGEDAIKLAKEYLPDLILLDVMMPGMNGFEVCRRLKAMKETKDIPVIFLTSLSDGTNESKGLHIGAADYISKPFNPELLKLRIENHLNLSTFRHGLELEVALRTQELVQTKNAAIAGMAMLAEYRDPETGAHIERTRHYVKLLAEELQNAYPVLQDPEVRNTLFISAPLHDIGKVGVPDAILLKPHSLSREEFKIMEQHAVLGRDVLERTEIYLGTNSFLHYAKEIAGSHHEKWDGSGYPLGLKGEEIPLSARIMAIADIYDALISKRPYKEAFSHDVALKIILHGDDTTKPEHFDPIILATFNRIHLKIKAIADKFNDPHPKHPLPPTTE